MKKALPGLIIVLGAILVLGGSYWIFRNITMARDGIRVEAEVVEVVEVYRPGRSSENSTMYYPVLEYRTMAGDLKRTQSSVSKIRNGASAYQVGDRVDVYYDPEDPSQVILASTSDLYVPGVIAAGLGLALFAGEILRRRRVR
ncbi:DUF3592 domain-containing protein [Alkalibacter rhizosphaerae]|uniref:DUF3592 domain-containing protein n=1 Tax=Alkalibacter rhizosphaerae TaxID=2815577 RepID=A0A974XFW7_9FIRM|nr:DUF3592 domain-containing protein [Alkalibacter rhizosphaerae]QSX09107.1 DUF3592 domain-containing protein [Alkalibacter rhizosphaerae]